MNINEIAQELDLTRDDRMITDFDAIMRAIFNECDLAETDDELDDVCEMIHDFAGNLIMLGKIKMTIGDLADLIDEKIFS